MTTLFIVLIVANAITLAVLAVFVRANRRARRAARRVEGPNSGFKSPYVVDLEAKERWEAIALDRLHEVNRSEVEKLLQHVRDQGVRSLAPPERALLDRMAEAASSTLPKLAR
jgi:hypothetical protein